MIAATKGFTRWAGLVLAVSLPLMSTQAHAASVTVGGITYQLGSVTGSFTANSALLQRQAWWGSQALANTFANAAGNIGGGLFAYETYNPGIPSVRSISFVERDEGDFGTVLTGTSQSVSSTYITATASASSVPEINAGSLSQALLILFALWLVTRRRPALRVA
jgi:hypothetical protein